jgi:hypothetical protein
MISKCSCYSPNESLLSIFEKGFLCTNCPIQKSYPELSHSFEFIIRKGELIKESIESGITEKEIFAEGYIDFIEIDLLINEQISFGKNLNTHELKTFLSLMEVYIKGINTKIHDPSNKGKRELLEYYHSKLDYAITYLNKIQEASEKVNYTDLRPLEDKKHWVKIGLRLLKLNNSLGVTEVASLICNKYFPGSSERDIQNLRVAITKKRSK